MDITQRDINRFYRHVSEPNENGCRLWTGAKTHGYGNIRFNGKIWKTHRFAYHLYHTEEDIEGWCICHTCDVPSCVEETHLWKGTKQDNAVDMCNKERHADLRGTHVNCGENSPRAKLTEEDVRVIRHRFDDEYITKTQLAKDYGVSIGCIQHVINKMNWKEVN